MSQLLSSSNDFGPAPNASAWLEQADAQLSELLTQNRDDFSVESLLEQSLDAARQAGETLLLGRLLTRRSLLLSRRHRFVESLEAALEADFLLQTHPFDDARLLCQTLQSLLYRELGSYEQSLQSCERALEAARTLKNVREEVRALGQLAGTLDHLERYPEAVAAFEQAERLSRTEGMTARAIQAALNRQGVVQNWGDALLERGEHQQARELFENLVPQLENTLREALEHNMETYTSALYHNLGLAQLHLNNFAAAQDYQHRALEVARQQQHQPFQASATRLAGRIAQQKGTFVAAIEHHQAALSLFESLQAVLEMQTSHQALEQTYLALADYPKAYGHAKEAHRLELSIRTEATERQLRVLMTQRKLEQVQTQAELERVRGAELERKVQERTVQLEAAHLETLEKLSIAAEFRDSDTGKHTLRVGNRSAQVAEALGLEAEQVQALRLAARLHDVGKIAISDTILHKPGKLTEAEFDTMKGHTVAGARMLEQGGSALLEMAEQIALSHHERWDGSGYPQKLAGETIPLMGRIVAVVDVLDALTSERPYKRAWTLEDAMSEICAQSGKHFDPQVVEALEKVIENEIRMGTAPKR